MSKKQDKLKTIVIDGQEYTYRETMGAMVDFKNETGLDAPEDVEDILKYMYHVVKSNCRREHREFNMSFREFADGLDGDEFQRFTETINSSAQEEPGKNV